MAKSPKQREGRYFQRNANTGKPNKLANSQRCATVRSNYGFCVNDACKLFIHARKGPTEFPWATTQWRSPVVFLLILKKKRGESDRECNAFLTFLQSMRRPIDLEEFDVIAKMIKASRRKRREKKTKSNSKRVTSWIP